MIDIESEFLTLIFELIKAKLLLVENEIENKKSISFAE
jgi:hypothetical protein